MLNVWLKDPYRSTQDVDLFTTGTSDETNLVDFISAVCSVTCVEDAVTFDLSPLVISEMSAANGYDGQRAKFTARIGTIKTVLKIDFGFGDVVSPARMRSFLAPLRKASIGNQAHVAIWPAGGPWTARDDSLLLI